MYAGLGTVGTLFLAGVIWEFACRRRNICKIYITSCYNNKTFSLVYLTSCYDNKTIFSLVYTKCFVAVSLRMPFGPKVNFSSSDETAKLQIPDKSQMAELDEMISQYQMFHDGWIEKLKHLRDQSNGNTVNNTIPDN